MHNETSGGAGCRFFGGKMIAFETSGCRVQAEPMGGAACPIVYLPVSDAAQAADVFALQTKLRFSLVCVTVRDWNADLSPWPAPPLSPKDVPFAGGADAFLRCLTEEIVPRAEALLPAAPSIRCIAGYSMAGLFALYALYRTDRFSRVAAASASLWYPQFLPFAKTQPFCSPPQRIALSLGDREGQTRHPVLRTVEENTTALFSHYQSAGLPVTFTWNKGTHFTDPQGRMARAIAAILPN